MYRDSTVIYNKNVIEHCILKGMAKVNRLHCNLRENVIEHYILKGVANVK